MGLEGKLAKALLAGTVLLGSYAPISRADPPADEKKQEESVLAQIAKGMTGSAAEAVSERKTAEDYIREGRRAYLRNDLAKAIENFDLALDINKSLDPAKYWKGEALCMQGLYAEAKATFDSISDVSYIRTGEAVVKCFTGDCAGAEKILSEIKIKRAETFNILGYVFWKLGKIDDANNAYREGLELNNRMPELHQGIGFTLCSKGEYAKSLESYETALSIEPEYAQAHFGRARTLYKLNRIEESKASLRESLRIDPSNELAQKSYSAISSR